jgi:hypothetical protein
MRAEERIAVTEFLTGKTICPQMDEWNLLAVGQVGSLVSEI